MLFLSLATQDSNKIYLRFSSVPIEDIKMKLYLESKEFVLAMFETMVLYIYTSYIHVYCVCKGCIHVTGVMENIKLQMKPFNIHTHIVQL